MMLYVFHVDVGRMMSFDMTVALSSVENLKQNIERLHGIPMRNIVLLVSGGEMLLDDTQVACYSAGTDSNPIFMFLTGETNPPITYVPNDPDIDLREQVERCCEMPAVYETVVTRAQLALKMYDLARDEDRIVERLVHEQHLQQQGWSAVVANLEDLTEEFRRRFSNFCAAFDEHLLKRSKHIELLRNFGDDLEKLSRIPILPGLMPLAEQVFDGFDDFLKTNEVFTQSVAPPASAIHGTDADTDDDGGDGKQQKPTLENRASARADDDKSSTSPNKKLKMGHEEDESTTITTMTMTTTTTTTTTTITTVDQHQRQTISAEGANSHSSTNSDSRRRSLNLLQWITSKESHQKLRIMSDECIHGLSTFNEDSYETLKAEVNHIIKLADKADVKEIRGLGERLCKLEEMKYRMKRMVNDQKELSTAFQQNQNRAINLRDPSILPDLCASHKSQLIVMSQNHIKIRDLRRTISRAKDELGINLHTRLGRIVFLENSMSEIDNRLLFYHRCLLRAEKHISIIEQIHQAPCIYLAAVAEVVRRRIFSSEFIQWASKLTIDFEAIHSEEISRRTLFNKSFDGHFLNTLFPGLKDMPPIVVNECPMDFDTRLPNITKSDIDMLTTYLPDLSTELQLPDMEPVINFFVSRSVEYQRSRLEELLKQQKTTLQNQRLAELQAGDGGGCDESETTDTETEFEKVPVPSVQTIATSTSENQQQMPDTIARSTLTDRLITQSAETLTEDNEATTRAEVERLEGILTRMSKLTTDCICLARENLETFRSDAGAYQEDMYAEMETMKEKIKLVRMQSELHDQELEQTLAECTTEVQLLHETLEKQTNEMMGLRDLAAKSEALELKNSMLEMEMEQLRAQLHDLQQQSENAVALERDRLVREHKTELESLRCRFKLMTPSDMMKSLDRSIEEKMSISQFEAMIVETKATLEAEKEKAIAAAIEIERSLWQSKIFPMNSESVMANVNILKDMLEEKERQLDQLREKDLILTKENYQLKTRLDALTNEEASSWLKEKIEYLNRDKNRLEEELTMEKSRRLEMESSCAALKVSTYEPQATAGLGCTLSRSKSSSSSSHKNIVLESLSKGDIVFVVWSVRHAQFMVVQDSQNLYFVHGDSLAGLNLRLPPVATTATEGAVSLPPIPLPYYAIGRVTDKEYCQARKDENRYRVTRGSKFYRIKLAPLPLKHTRRERIESAFSNSSSSSISRSISQSDATHIETSMPTIITTNTNTTTSTAAMAMSSSTATMTASTMLCESTISSSTTSTLTGKDDIDAAVIVATSSSSGRGSAGSGAAGAAGIGSYNKERTISISSVAEEDDEPVSLSLSERCGYISVSEEDEMQQQLQPTAAGGSDDVAILQQLQSQSVITEQPTATLNMELLFAASGDNNVPTTTTTTTTTTTQDVGDIDLDENMPQFIINNSPLNVSTTSAGIPTVAIGSGAGSGAISGGCQTASEDSDEYRSLEAKDDTDFTISA